MNQLGDNNPPDMTITAGEVTKDLSRWMSEIPIIETEDQAREAKLWADRAFLCVQDLEDERREKIRPHRKIVEEIHEYYKRPRELLQGVLNELKSRMDEFLRAEEAKRKAAAEEARRIAASAEQAARVAERQESGARSDASSGVLGIDIAVAQEERRRTSAEAERAARQAALAEKESHVKIGGGFRRASSLRSTEVPCIVDALQVIEEVGITQDIEVALIKAARAFKRLHGRFPRGITVTIERGI